MGDISLIKKKFIDYIDNVIISDKTSHAYLIEVDNYDNDMNYILSFIKMILCNLKYSELDKSDNNIISLIDNNNYPDLYYVSSDTAVINKSLIIDLQKEFNNKSLLDGKRIYIIKEAEKLNSSSANTILKFLEEPEDDIIAFLITNNRYHVIDTILSRCQVLSLKENNYKVDIDNNLIDFFDCIINPNNFFIKYNYYMKELFLDKKTIKNSLIEIENIMVIYIENSMFISDEINNLLSTVSKNKLINIVTILDKEIPKMEYNVNLKLWVDSLFSKLIGGNTDD